MFSDYLEEIESGVTLFEYIDKARTGKVWDVKVTNNTEIVIKNIKIYRGMPIDTRDGLPVYASARDVGNIAAGYVAGVHGMSWVAARIGFDVYQSYKSMRITVEGISTQSAQWYGWKIGHRQWLSEYGKMNEKNYYAF